MSRSIWTRCGGRTNLRRLECRPWRIVEGQHILSARKLVDSVEEYEVLEHLIDQTKPPLPSGPEFAGLHYLLSTPFRYPPLRHGSRFGRRTERSMWYGAEELGTAFAEYAYYRVVLFDGTSADLAPSTITVTAFRASVRTEAGVDLTQAPFDAHRSAISSRTTYADSQQLGSDMRSDAVEAFRYSSARCPHRGTNIGLFTPTAFASKNPVRPMQNWFCTVTAQLDVEYRREDVGAVRKFDFPKTSFLVAGSLPHPAV